MLYVGLPQWQHAAWHRLGLRDLGDYARYFNCVEGNTTFYALPSPELVLRWRDMTHDDFRFCFKFPSAISHQAALRHCDRELQQFFRCLAPLSARIGQIWLQLPAAFGPAQLNDLWRFTDALPQAFSYGVEVRHARFFAKGDDERALNQGLHQRGINRVILDSRPVHHALPDSPAMREAQRKKPRLPVHAVLTANQPLIRFIGNENLHDNLRWFQPWRAKLTRWLAGSPFLFIHTPDIGDAPQLAQALWPLLTESDPSMPDAPDWPQQNSLF
ncbi:DUF72 domain-containing protein [Affinibrenneria salicis]|uniref:DUF72 domain-containing protein n=1 Tax=Affinibrenneria salicis TaxID=2590031 RepID=A0A5J5G485_9GAMM|nr:DUF72 domain-containing protein [Affinibrenneria salicis]KAA9001673.1 DUF72 domain-containing protein [Affinibrenneria salicis]